ncbi:MAG: MarR family transcriptional regulator [Streptosporangiales bacterium]|nr:MarR family transcriptional regulator [Streptosporangiales bacterium]
MQDEVDRLVEAWRRERPDLDVAPLDVLSRVSRLARHLDLARRTVLDGHDLEVWEFDVLTTLRRAGPPYELSPSELLKATLVTSGTMTNRIQRLAASGLVSRHPDPRDGRGARIRLTARGRTTADSVMADLLREERTLLASLTDAQRTTLASLLRTLLLPFDN